MTYTCQYDHGYRRVGGAATATTLLQPVPNGRHETIAYRCPICQRAWPALPAVDIGRRGAELLPVDAKARRAKMMEALQP